jgi:hypothetical protein
MAATALTPPAEPAKPAPRVEVEFKDGKLSIHSARASLAEVLREVQRRTGVSVAIPAGAEQEPVIANLGPASPREVLTALLDGSPFNFIIVGSDSDPAVVRNLFITPRGSATADVPANYGSSAPAVAQTAPEPQVEVIPPTPEPAPEPPPAPDANAPPPQQ